MKKNYCYVLVGICALNKQDIMFKFQGYTEQMLVLDQLKQNENTISVV